VAFLEFAKKAPEQFKYFNKEILPLVYVARHDPNEEIQKVNHFFE
jgi:hypothetical protein